MLKVLYGWRLDTHSAVQSTRHKKGIRNKIIQQVSKKGNKWIANEWHYGNNDGYSISTKKQKSILNNATTVGKRNDL